MASKLVDQLNNPIEVGDLLHCSLPSASAVGLVIKITPGSTLGIRGTKSGQVEESVTPGIFYLRIDLPFTFDPRENIARNALRVVDPMKANKADIKLT